MTGEISRIQEAMRGLSSISRNFSVQARKMEELTRGIHTSVQSIRELGDRNSLNIRNLGDVSSLFKVSSREE